VSIRDQLAEEFQHLILHIRDHAPDAVINTRLAQSDERAVIVHAQIVASAGLAAGAHGSAEPQEGAAELAENRALTRAMIALGLPDMDETPAPRLHSVTGGESSGRVVQFPTQDASPDAETTPENGEPAPEDVSWTAFWKWAKVNGFNDKASLEAAIGQSIDRMSPAEARRLALSIRST
jgi:hypothetical protein